ncbi:MAG: two-component system LytT family sensor kinase [Urechidicola sp.]|jgi:two-component system LytT family sensor kinase
MASLIIYLYCESMNKATLYIKLFGRIILHILFWCGVLLFYTYFFGYGSTNLDYVLRFSLFLLPITIATTYFSVYKLIPSYLIKKKYFQFILYSGYTIIISSYLIVISIFYGLIFLSKFKYDEMAPISQNLFFVMLGVYIVTIIASTVKLFKLHLKNTKNANLLETKILETQLKLKEQELHYLKMQIHPHFLFNTLNTLYGFALKKADETPEMIIKLSNLLDYLLYQSDKPFVALSEEINHIEDYIALEKMRFNDSLDISFQVNNSSKDYKIAPMLLIPFVENSFKHGTLSEGILHIDIELYIEDTSLHFYIENTSSKKEFNPIGIGLENIKKRLQLLYGNRHQLHINNDNNTFSVHLQIDNLIHG